MVLICLIVSVHTGTERESKEYLLQWASELNLTDLLEQAYDDAGMK